MELLDDVALREKLIVADPELKTLKTTADKLHGRLDNDDATAFCHAFGFRTRTEVDEIMASDDDFDRQRLHAMLERRRRNDERRTALYAARARNIRRTLETERAMSREPIAVSTAVSAAGPRPCRMPARSPRSRISRRVRRVARAPGRARREDGGPEPVVVGGRGWL